MYFSRIRSATHILRVNCAEMARDYQDNLIIKSSALNLDFSSLSTDPLSSRSVHASVKEGYPHKSGYFSAIGSCSVKMLQIDTDMLLIITRTSNELLVLFASITLNALKSSKLRVLVTFLRFSAAAHTSRVNCDEMTGDRLRQSAKENC